MKKMILFGAALLCVALVSFAPRCAASATTATAGEDEGADKPAEAAAGAIKTAASLPTEFLDFAKEIAKAFTENNTAFIEASFDKAAFADRYGNVPGFPTGHYRKKFQKYLNDLQIANVLTESPEWLGKGTAVVRGCYRENDGVRAVIRMDDSKGGFRWIEFTIFTKPGSKKKEKDKTILLSALYIGDLYSSGMGTSLSEVLRADFSPIVINEAPKNRAKALLDATAFENYLKEMLATVAIRNAVRDGNPAAAVTAYEKAPDPVRKKVWIQLLALRAAEAAGKDSPLALKIRDEIIASSLSDLAAGYALRDYLLAQKRYADYRLVLQTIGDRFGTDAGQVMDMAACCKAEGKPDEALAFYQKARTLEPRLQSAFDAEFDHYLAANDFPSLKALFLEYHKAYPEVDLSKYIRGLGERFEDFLISTDYMELQTALRKELKEKEPKEEEESGKKKSPPAKTGTKETAKTSVKVDPEAKKKSGEK